VFVRVLAVLVTLGLLVGSAHAHDLSAPPAVAVLVEELDDNQEALVLVGEGVALEESRSAPALMASETAPGYEHLWSVFRPPRAYAFN
jgi:hypothetical protein